MATNDRAEALAALRVLGAGGAISNAEPEVKVERTGDEVYAGGDTARLLIRPVHLSYVRDGVRHYPQAQPGDTVLLTEAQAKRLDSLGATVDPDTSDEDVDAALDGEVTDEQLATMGAAELVAYVGQHPEEAERVRTLELERPEDKQRKTVLKATDEEATAEAKAQADAEAEAKAQAAAEANGDDDGDDDGATE